MTAVYELKACSAYWPRRIVVEGDLKRSSELRASYRHYDVAQYRFQVIVSFHYVF